MNDVPNNNLEQEMTIFQAIARLEELSWKLNAKVYGERPEKNAEQTIPTAGDKVTQARNKITEISGRLESILLGLKSL